MSRYIKQNDHQKNISLDFQISIDEKKAYDLMMILIWTYNTLFVYIRVIITKLAMNNYRIGYAIMNVLFMLSLLYSYPVWKEIVRKKNLLFTAVLFFAFFFCIEFNPQTVSKYYLKNMSIPIFCVNIPFFFFGTLYDSSLLEKLKIASMASIYAYAVYRFTIGSGGMDGSYHMSDAYSLLPHVCLMLYSCKTHKFKYIVTFIFGFILEFIMGTRGPVLLTLLLYFLIFLYELFHSESKQRTAAIFGIVALSLILILFYDTILASLGNIAKSLGASTRIIDTLSKDALFSSKGRDLITESLVSTISRNPYKGYGMAADIAIAGNYAHNFVMELIVSYGIVIAVAITVLIIFLIIQRLRHSCKEDCVFLFILLCSGFVKLFLSSSYIMEPFFFLLLGFCLGTSQSKPVVRSDNAICGDTTSIMRIPVSELSGRSTCRWRN